MHGRWYVTIYTCPCVYACPVCIHALCPYLPCVYNYCPVYMISCVHTCLAYSCLVHLLASCIYVPCEYVLALSIYLPCVYTYTMSILALRTYLSYVYTCPVHIYLALDIYLTYVYILALCMCILGKGTKKCIKLWGQSCLKNSMYPIKISELNVYDFSIYTYFSWEIYIILQKFYQTVFWFILQTVLMQTFFCKHFIKHFLHQYSLDYFLCKYSIEIFHGNILANSSFYENKVNLLTLSCLYKSCHT